MWYYHGYTKYAILTEGTFASVESEAKYNNFPFLYLCKRTYWEEVYLMELVY